MAIGTSGRIVIEVDVSLKMSLHNSLQKDGLTLKDWFTAEAERYLRGGKQLELPFHVLEDGSSEKKDD